MTSLLKRRYDAGITAAIALVLTVSYTNNETGKNPLQPVSINTDIDNIVEEEMAKQDIIGVVVGVVQDGNIIHTKAYGHKDQLRTQPMTTSTVLRWASISKTLTSVAAWKAIEDKKMTLFDKVKDHVSYWPSTGDKGNITIQHLLSQRSGITHYGEDENDIDICNPSYSAYTANNNFSAEQSVNVFKNCALGFSPNNTYCYSTFGYNLLGAVIEEATNIPYEKYVDDSIADKGGMNSPTAYSSDPGGFVKDCNTCLKTDTEGDVEYKLPGGGWASNITDLTKFMQGLMNNTFLKATLALYVPVTGNTNPDYLYGVFAEMLGTKLHINHGDAHDNVRTYMGFFPWEKNGVCVMINSGGYVDEVRLAKKIQEVLGYNWNKSDKPLDYCGENSEANNNCGHTMTAVWRNTGKANDVLLRRGYKTDEFHEEWEKLIDAGYYADDIETWMDGTVRKWDGIFKKTTKRSAMWRGFTTDDWFDKWEEMTNDGLRLIDLETYLDGVTRKWADTFIESSEPYAMYRGFTTDDFGDKYFEMEDKNMKRIDVETYMDGLVRKWAGVWKGNGSSLLNRNYTEDDFEALCALREKSGYNLMDVDTYMDGTVRKWAGVWENTNVVEHFRLNKKMCDLINNYHNVYKKDGYELLDLEKY